MECYTFAIVTRYAILFQRRPASRRPTLFICYTVVDGVYGVDGVYVHHIFFQYQVRGYSTSLSLNNSVRFLSSMKTEIYQTTQQAP